MAHDAQRKRIFLLLAGTVVVAAAVYYLQRRRRGRRAAAIAQSRAALLESGVWENDLSDYEEEPVPGQGGATPAAASGAASAREAPAAPSTAAQHPGPAAATPIVPPLDMKEVKPHDALDGLGPFRPFEHRFLTYWMKYYLEPKDVAALMRVSRVFYVMCSIEARLWKRFVLATKQGDFSFKSSWRRTYFLSRDRVDDHPVPKIEAPGFYSPRMVRWDYRAKCDLNAFVSAQPYGVPRRAGLSVLDFVHEYAALRLPVILTDVCTKWPAAKEWTKERLVEKYGDVKFRTAAHLKGKPIRMTMRDYVTYMNNNKDEDPIYLFDRHFYERAPNMLNEYSVPEYFQEDLFTVLGDRRPDYRWLVIGPKRSGTSFHIDPYLTSAWNALLHGRKLWLLFPPGPPPPGVRLVKLPDGEERWDSPKPIKWMLEYRRQCTVAPLEVVQEAGEMIYVPGGWWHMVINLEDAIAVTQNIADSCNFPLVWGDMQRSQSRHAEPWLQALYPLRPDLFYAVGVVRPEIPVIRPPPGVELAIPKDMPIKYRDEVDKEQAAAAAAATSDAAPAASASDGKTGVAPAAPIAADSASAAPASVAASESEPKAEDK